MNVSVFKAPGRILFGAGAIERIGAGAAACGAVAVVVIGRGSVRKAGILDRVLASLADADMGTHVFEGVEPEPECTTVDRCRQAIRDAGAEVVVGLGGGSVMDAAKVAAGLARDDRPTAEFLHGRAEIDGPGLPYLAVPTTSGTGSEMTNNGVISDREAGCKASIRHESLIPRIALVDPELTIPCPPGVTAASGVDAMVQAIESYLSRHATPMTEAISLRAAEELHAALPGVVHRGDDLALRTRAAWGSAAAGLALSNARLGVVHGMAHPVGVRYGIAHGEVCGVLLAPVLAFNRPAAPEKYERLAKVLGADPAEYARDLLAACGLPETLEPYGADPADFPAIAAESMPSGSTKANPRDVAEADVVALLEEALDPARRKETRQ